MKRNWDTIRELLTKVEECTHPTDAIQLGDFEKERAAEISYHMRLLIEAGLVQGHMSRSLSADTKTFYVMRLTWNGHEFLDAIRSDTVWDRTKTIFFEQGISMTFDLVKDAAKGVASLIFAAAVAS